MPFFTIFFNYRSTSSSSSLSSSFSTISVLTNIILFSCYDNIISTFLFFYYFPFLFQPQAKNLHLVSIRFLFLYISLSGMVFTWNFFSIFFNISNIFSLSDSEETTTAGKSLFRHFYFPRSFYYPTIFAISSPDHLTSDKIFRFFFYSLLLITASSFSHLFFFLSTRTIDYCKQVFFFLFNITSSSFPSCTSVIFFYCQHQKNSLLLKTFFLLFDILYYIFNRTSHCQIFAFLT